MLKLTVLIITSIVATLICSCSGSGSGASSSGSVELKAVFHKKTVGKSAALDVNISSIGIVRLTLDAIPVHSDSFHPPQINLLDAFKLAGTTSYTLSGMTDDEVYLFRIIAYDQNGTAIYGGQNYATLRPKITNTIAINCLPLSGTTSLSAVFGSWSGARGTTPFNYNVSASGVATGSDVSGGKLSGWFLPSINGGFDSFFIVNASSYATGALNPASGNGSATEYSKTETSWTFNKNSNAGSNPVAALQTTLGQYHFLDIAKDGTTIYALASRAASDTAASTTGSILTYIFGSYLYQPVSNGTILADTAGSPFILSDLYLLKIVPPSALTTFKFATSVAVDPLTGSGTLSIGTADITVFTSYKTKDVTDLMNGTIWQIDKNYLTLTSTSLLFSDHTWGWYPRVTANGVEHLDVLNNIRMLGTTASGSGIGMAGEFDTYRTNHSGGIISGNSISNTDAAVVQNIMTNLSITP